MIYLDYNASTPMAPEVKEAMILAWDQYGNPSGTHSSARSAETLFENARAEIALELGVNPLEVILTSGSTEALSIALWGKILGAPTSRTKVLVSAIEHEAVLATAEVACKIAKKELVIIPVIGFSDSIQVGQVNLEFISENIGADVALIAVMAVNNETGIIQPIEKVAELAEKFDVPFLCDSTQALGKQETFSMSKIPAMFTVSGHKIYGPKSSGALVMSRELQKTLVPIIPGGGQERGIRGGTLNAASAVGLAKALKFAQNDLQDEMRRQEKLRDRLLTALAAEFNDSMTSNSGTPTFCLKNTLNLRFHSASSDAVLVSLAEVAASRASACSAGMEEPSHVLLAMGMTSREAEESMRFSLGRFTTPTEIEAAIEDVSVAVTRVRALS
jgi:cysteine desulfurase